MWSETHKMLKEKSDQTRMLGPGKWSFKSEGEIKKQPDKSCTSKFALQKIIKDFFQVGGKWYNGSETWTWKTVKTEWTKVKIKYFKFLTTIACLKQ